MYWKRKLGNFPAFKRSISLSDCSDLQVLFVRSDGFFGSTFFWDVSTDIIDKGIWLDGLNVIGLPGPHIFRRFSGALEELKKTLQLHQLVGFSPFHQKQRNQGV